MIARIGLVIASLAACARGGIAFVGDDGAVDQHPSDARADGRPDASDETTDAPFAPADAAVDARPDAAIDAAVDAAIDAAIDAPLSATTQLLLTEVVLAPTGGEMIEIANPSDSPVDLTRYYLSDSSAYFRLPGGNATVDATDFIVRFPAGAMIPANGVVTVALDSVASFTSTYSTAPTYSIAAGTMTTVTMNGTPSLTNAGEAIVLFYWDGQTDLVRDVDLLLAGIPTTANSLADKSGYTVDGPDGDPTTSAYRPDARTLTAQAAAPNASMSTKRVAPEAGFETQGGTGNGLTGDDETSENTAMTWDTTFGIPTPGSVPASVLQ